MNILLGLAVIAFGFGIYYSTAAQSAAIVSTFEEYKAEEGIKLMKRFFATSAICFLISGISVAFAF